MSKQWLKRSTLTIAVQLIFFFNMLVDMIVVMVKTMQLTESALKNCCHMNPQLSDNLLDKNLMQEFPF